MHIARGVWRFILLGAAVLVGAVFGLLGLARREWLGKLAMVWPAMTLILLGVRVRRRGQLAGGALLVGNHISWLDPLALGANWPIIFLGNSDVARLPILGRVFARAGTLFIERGRGASRAMREIADALRARQNVMLFAEGKTSRGDSVSRFHPRLFQAAIDAGAPVQPVAIRYFDAGGRPVAHHSLAGGATLLRGLWAAASRPPVVADITLLAPIAPGRDRQTLARRAEDAVRAVIERATF